MRSEGVVALRELSGTCPSHRCGGAGGGLSTQGWGSEVELLALCFLGKFF